MPVCRPSSLLIGLWLLCATAASQAETATRGEINWSMSPWPGLINARDDKPDSGIVVELLKQITQRLPEYRHRYSLVNLSRGLEQLKHGSLTCFLPIFRTPERDQLGHYVSVFVAMPHQLLVRDADVERISNGQAEVSLQRLLHDPHLRGGLIKDRSYGPALDPLLQDPEVQARLLRIQTGGSGGNLYDMLEYGRVDYLLDYAETLPFFQQQGLARHIALLPLSEANTPYVSGIYCSKTTEGAQLIKRIDQIAQQPEVIVHFRAAQQKYIPAATLQHYQPWLDAFFQQRAQRDMTSLAP
ncbi:MAG: TIGR02285 family protein [Pseudomonas sp.]